MFNMLKYGTARKALGKRHIELQKNHLLAMPRHGKTQHHSNGSGYTIISFYFFYYEALFVCFGL